MLVVAPQSVGGGLDAILASLPEVTIRALALADRAISGNALAVVSTGDVQARVLFLALVSREARPAKAFAAVALRLVLAVGNGARVRVDVAEFTSVAASAEALASAAATPMQARLDLADVMLAIVPIEAIWTPAGVAMRATSLAAAAILACDAVAGVRGLLTQQPCEPIGALALAILA